MIHVYAEQAAVDSAHHVIIAADIIGSGSEQSMLLPMIAQAEAYRDPHAGVTAGADYQGEADKAALRQKEHPCASRRQPDARARRALYDKPPTGRFKTVQRFKPQDFAFHDDNTATCPAGPTLTSNGIRYTTATRLRYQLYTSRAEDFHR